MCASLKRLINKIDFPPAPIPPGILKGFKRKRDLRSKTLREHASPDNSTEENSGTCHGMTCEGERKPKKTETQRQNPLPGVESRWSRFTHKIARRRWGEKGEEEVFEEKRKVFCTFSTSGVKIKRRQAWAAMRGRFRS